jgi:hypothetical protein
MAYEINFLGDNHATVHGVCDGTADTALATLPPNPWNDAQIACMSEGEGVYVEDDGSVAPRQSGALQATIDVRSSVAGGKFFVVHCFKLGSGEGNVRDHSAITT